MSYDAFTFRLPEGADPSDYATEVLEAFDDGAEPAPSDPTVSALVAAFRSVFPGVDVVEESEEGAMLLLEDRLVSVDVWRSHCEICVSYGVPHDAAWITGLLQNVATATSAAGHDTLFDPQLGRPIAPSDAADAAEIGAKYGQGLAFVERLHEEAEASSGDDAPRAGFFRRLFGRG